MASLINNKTTLLDFIKIQFINDESSFPDFTLAAERFLIPLIGQTLYDKLLNEVTLFDLPAEGEDPQEIADIVLVNKCRAVIAPLGYLMELASIQTQITDSGIKTTNTENLQAAHRWEYNEVRDLLIDKGSYAIESLLVYLFENKDDWMEWTDSDEYKQANELIFKTGKEFNRYFKVYQPHRVWWELLPVITEVEDQYIKSSIGSVFFKELKEMDAPEEDSIEDQVMILLKKIVAQFTILKAIEKLSVIKTDKGFTVQLSAGSSDAANAGDAPASDNKLSLLYESCSKDGNAYLLQLIELLNENASESVFNTYFTSKYYTAPSTTTETSKNATRKIFGL